MSTLDHRNPLVIDTRDLSRRAGTERELELTAPAPAELGIEVLKVPEGAPVEIELRLEAVLEGVLVTGTAHAELEGECVRCLDPIEDDIDVRFQELFVYHDSRDARREDGYSAEDDDEVHMLVDDVLDLEPVLRNAVVLALPFQPLCQDDCAGLCPDCGANLNEDPNHGHDAPIDPRWAGLADLQPGDDADGAEA